MFVGEVLLGELVGLTKLENGDQIMCLRGRSLGLIDHRGVAPCSPRSACSTGLILGNLDGADGRQFLGGSSGRRLRLAGTASPARLRMSPIVEAAGQSVGGVALRLNVRLRPLAKMTALEDEIHGALSLKLAA